MHPHPVKHCKMSHCGVTIDLFYNNDHIFFMEIIFADLAILRREQIYVPNKI